MTAGRRILFVDDDPVVQRAVQRLAVEHQFDLMPVLAGADVYKIAVETSPDLIVLDIKFPDADGRDVLARLKADPRTLGIPVVVWSGRDPESDRRIALHLGAEDYVEKRDPAALLPKIERVLLRLRSAASA